jgi:hypothetical protein
MMSIVREMGASVTNLRYCWCNAEGAVDFGDDRIERRPGDMYLPLWPKHAA